MGSVGEQNAGPWAGPALFFVTEAPFFQQVAALGKANVSGWQYQRPCMASSVRTSCRPPLRVMTTFECIEVVRFDAMSERPSVAGADSRPSS
jgi:hypothetical protein